MSCSKFSTATPATSVHGLDIGVHQEIQKIKTRFGHGFKRTTEAFCIVTKNGETEDITYYLAQKFITPNKKGEPKTSNDDGRPPSSRGKCSIHRSEIS
jgi:hypothetical protein